MSRTQKHCNTQYGVRPTNAEYAIANHSIKFCSNNIIVGNVQYPGTIGLYELLFKNT